MNSIIELRDRWKEITETIEELTEERRNVRRKIIEFGGTVTNSKREQKQERRQGIIAFFKEGKTTQEIADLYGVSRQAINQKLNREGITKNDGGRSVRKKLKSCSVNGCLNKGPYSKSYCPKHYMRFLKSGDPLKTSRVFREPVCTVEGCNLKHKSNGYCNTHLYRWRTKGDAGSAEISPVGKHKNRGKQRKLSDSQIEEIRSLYVRGKGVSGKPSEFSTSGLGKKFGVSASAISLIINNQL